jgi:hypothetical protein
VESVVSRFYAAYDGHDGSAACALLAPASRRAVVSAAGKPCSAGLLDEKLPGTGRPATVSAYGDQAQARMNGDTVFVAKFPGGWRVVAVGCTPIAGKPYQCEVEAG